MSEDLVELQHIWTAALEYFEFDVACQGYSRMSYLHAKAVHDLLSPSGGISAEDEERWRAAVRRRNEQC